MTAKIFDFKAEKERRRPLARYAFPRLETTLSDDLRMMLEYYGDERWEWGAGKNRDEPDE